MKNILFTLFILTGGFSCLAQTNIQYEVKLIGEVNFRVMADSLSKAPHLKESVVRDIHPIGSSASAVGLEAHTNLKGAKKSTLKEYKEPLKPSPPPLITFKGVVSDNTITPPNTGVAAGGQYILNTTNLLFLVKNQKGDSITSMPMHGLFGTSNGVAGVFDPKCLYDSAGGRFIVSAGYKETGIVLAISKTKDPTDAWYIYSLANDSGIVDYPCTGYNKSKIAVSCNIFPGHGKRVYSKIFVFDKVSLYSGRVADAHVFVDSVSNAGVYPAATFDANTDTLWCIEYVEAYQGITYGYLSYITGVDTPVYHGPYLLTFPVSSSYIFFNSARQLGTFHTIYTTDNRVSPVPGYRNGKLLFANTVSGPDTGKATYDFVEWFQIEPNSTGAKLVQYGTVRDSLGKVNYYFPSIVENAFGDILICYNVSSDSQYVSAGYSYHAASDTPGYMRTTYIYAKGVSPYYAPFSSRTNRWGDHNMACVDPLNQSFVCNVEISNDTLQNGTRSWFRHHYGAWRDAIAIVPASKIPRKKASSVEPMAPVVNPAKLQDDHK